MATQQEVFDTLTAEIRRIGTKLDGVRGPGVVNNPTSLTIRVSPDSDDESPQIAPNVHPIILRAPEVGGGFYKGDWQYNAPTLADGTSNLSLPLTGMKAGTNSRVLIFNPPESGMTGHMLSPTDGGEIYRSGLLIGRTSETPSRDIAMLIGGEKNLVGQYQGMVREMVTQNVEGFAFLQSHALDP